jgi:hypothetical protein
MPSRIVELCLTLSVEWQAACMYSIVGSHWKFYIHDIRSFCGDGRFANKTAMIDVCLLPMWLRALGSRQKGGVIWKGGVIPGCRGTALHTNGATCILDYNTIAWQSKKLPVWACPVGNCPHQGAHPDERSQLQSVHPGHRVDGH